MAYIKKTMAQGTGGQLGEGSTDMGGQTSNQTTTANNPQSFYNISDFLNANKQKPAIQGQIETQGSSDLQKSKDQAKNAISGVNTNIQSPYQYDQGAFDTALKNNDYDTVKKGYGQEYTPTDTATEIGSNAPTNPYAQIQPGSFNSLTNYFGNTTKTNNQYSQGEQKQDELLLRNQPDFVQNFGTKMNEQYKNEVENPYQEQVKALDTQKQKNATDTAAAQGQWKQGINDYLSKTKSAYDTELAKEQADYAGKQNETNSKTPLDTMMALLGDKYGMSDPQGSRTDPSGKTSALYGSYQTPEEPGTPYNLTRNPLVNIDTQTGKLFGTKQGGSGSYSDFISNYLTKNQGVAPSGETAAYNLGEAVPDYNALADIIGGSYQPLVAGKNSYSPDSYSLNKDKLRELTGYTF